MIHLFFNDWNIVLLNILYHKYTFYILKMIVCILWASIDSRILNNPHPPPPPNFPLKRFQCYNLSILTQKYKWKEKCLSFLFPFFPWRKIIKLFCWVWVCWKRSGETDFEIWKNLESENAFLLSYIKTLYKTSSCNLTRDSPWWFSVNSLIL